VLLEPPFQPVQQLQLLVQECRVTSGDGRFVKVHSASEDENRHSDAMVSVVNRAVAVATRDLLASAGICTSLLSVSWAARVAVR
jgi:hypothetical protein